MGDVAAQRAAGASAPGNLQGSGGEKLGLHESGRGELWAATKAERRNS